MHVTTRVGAGVRRDHFVRVTVEQRLSGQQSVHHRSDVVGQRPLVHYAALRLLGRHGLKRASRPARLRLAHSEAHNLHSTIGDDHVVEPKISVHHVNLLAREQCGAHGGHERRRVGFVHGVLLPQWRAHDGLRHFEHPVAKLAACDHLRNLRRGHGLELVQLAQRLLSNEARRKTSVGVNREMRICTRVVTRLIGRRACPRSD